MGKEALLVSCLLIIAGILVYWFYGRIQANREYALLHLIERITAKELTSHSLETELKEVIRERDEIIQDRFDEIVEKCEVLDIEKTMSAEEFFELAANAMSTRLNLDSSVLFKLFVDREKESSTVLSPGLAIPHIVIEAEHMFDILLVRCKEGIVFSKSKPKVHTVFVIIGTRVERNFHLYALSAIAQVIQSPDFEKKWLAARTSHALRDVVLLGERKRWHPSNS